MMRRTLAALALAFACAATLSGCLPPMLPSISPPDSTPVGDTDVVELPERGDCLAGSIDDRADWTSHVACIRPHSYDVIGSATWPGMNAAIEKHGAAKVHAKLNRSATDSLGSAYWQWAAEQCAAQLRQTVGWTSPTVSAQFDAWNVVPTGPWSLEGALADRDAFLDGHVATLCVLWWWEPVRYADGVTAADMFRGTFPALNGDCWIETVSEMLYSPCDQPHTDQTLLHYDVAASFGIDFVGPAEELSEEAWTATADRCAELLVEVSDVYDPERMYAWTAPSDIELWDALRDAPARSGQPYHVSCGIAMKDGSSFTGDALLGPLS